jgi:hypothetical protein
MDSSVSPTHGDQEKSVWNGHFGCACYHPLFVFNQFGDLERCALRAGNVHSADGWETVLKPIVARYKGTVAGIAFRGDAAFAQPNCTSSWRSKGLSTRSAFPQIRFSKHGSVICSGDRSGGRRTTYSGSTRAFTTRRRLGPVRDGLSPKWSGTSESCSRALDSLSVTCVTRRRISWSFTTSAAPPSSGSKNGRARKKGHGSRAAPSTRTRSASGFTR